MKFCLRSVLSIDLLNLPCTISIRKLDCILTNTSAVPYKMEGSRSKLTWVALLLDVGLQISMSWHFNRHLDDASAESCLEAQPFCMTVLTGSKEQQSN